MSIEKAEKAAFEYHSNGLHCAEAVCKSILENYGEGGYDDVPKSATAFGGGAINKFNGTCGAFAGAQLAVGYLYGRDLPGKEKTKKDCFNLIHKLGEKFVEKYGSLSCPAILEKFEGQENMIECRKLSGQTAKMLASIIEKINRERK